MIQKHFLDIFNIKLFENKRILIEENGFVNVDFFIIELIKHFKYSIFSYNNSSEHFKKLFELIDNNIKVDSIYNYNNNTIKVDYIKEYDIIDDIWTSKNLLVHFIQPKIGIFRCGTAKESDYYDYDIILQISDLKSGCSVEMDGSINIFARDNSFGEFKYKILNNKVEYFE